MNALELKAIENSMLTKKAEDDFDADLLLALSLSAADCPDTKQETKRASPVPTSRVSPPPVARVSPPRPSVSRIFESALQYLLTHDPAKAKSDHDHWCDALEAYGVQGQRVNLPEVVYMTLQAAWSENKDHFYDMRFTYGLENGDESVCMWFVPEEQKQKVHLTPNNVERTLAQMLKEGSTEKVVYAGQSRNQACKYVHNERTGWQKCVPSGIIIYTSGKFSK